MYNVTPGRVRVATVGVEAQSILCVVDINVTVSCVNKLSVTQQCSVTIL
jgi:hypothetical protein